MKSKIETMNRYFDAQIASCGTRAQALLADERADESNFEKVRANVYDIFRTMLSVAAATGKGDADAVRRFFLQKTEQLPAAWRASLEKANEHGDAAKAQIETIKLETLEEIKKAFFSAWGDEA